jgi:UDP-N-acetylmuramoyl-L-alanyl-D-glutamate--2,6-diaminopimelate ligase
MIPRPARLSALLDAANVRPLAPVAVDPEIGGVTLDSREVQQGDLFFALAGQVTDGMRFVPDAVRRGARAVLAASPCPADLDPAVAWVQVDEPRRAAGRVSRECWGRPDEALTLVGITGTNGKTTVSYLVHSIAGAAGLRAGRIGTVGYAFGETEREASRTTPEAPDLFRLLAEMREREVQLVALEVSSHGLALHRVEGARFVVAAFLNLGHDHLDFHGSAQEYLASKARLFEPLGPSQTAVLPAGDPNGDAIAARTRARILRFGRRNDAHVRLRDERCTPDGSTATLELEAPAVGVERTVLAVRTSLPGRFNLDNLAAAAACAIASGLPTDAIAGGIAALRDVPGRMERVERGQPFRVLVDYAHTPDALERLLAAVRELAEGRLLVVFGCGGERDRDKRPLMGRVAAEGADRLFLTSDNPRDEDPLAILADIERGMEKVAGAAERATTIAERPAAVEAAVAAAGPGDAVVIAGKGHETTQTIGSRAVRQTDRELAAAALAAAGWN